MTLRERADVEAALLVIGRAEPRCGQTVVVSIDGHSGAGKTAFTAALAERLPEAYVLHLDDMYPGWDGLGQAVSDLHDLVLAPMARGEQAAYRGWDWDNEQYGGWHRLPATQLLLVDGVGSGAGRNAELESALIWLEADPDLRFRRGIERDGEVYLANWQRWADQELALFAADRTRSRANLIVSTTP